jgi:hypothetical protein
MKALTEFLGLILFVLLLWLVIDVESHPDYYTTCLGSGHSYVRCFYDHNLKL